MIAIIVSTKDPAGMNIRNQLLRYPFNEDTSFRGKPVFSLGNIRLFTIDEDSVHAEGLDKEIDADIFIFATKHESSARRASLSVHAPGNWGSADLGGKPGILSVAAADHIKALYLELMKHSTGHEVTLEQTHHGPCINKPCLFIEIGCMLEHWQDEGLGKIIAGTIMHVLERPVKRCKTALFLGGGHYNIGANKVMERTDIAVGHICAKFLLGELTREKVKEAMQRTEGAADLVILDWKGLGKHKEHVKQVTEGFETARLKELIDSKEHS